MRFKPIDTLFLLALIAGAAYFIAYRMGFNGIGSVPLKGACVALLALWAGLQAKTLDGWLIAVVMAFGALGDVLIETNGLIAGAIGFLAGHVVAIWLYLRNRQGSVRAAIAVALVVALVAWWLPFARGLAPGIALYALGLGGMAGAALTSRFARDNVGIGALMFVGSDLLIFSELGPLHGSALPGLLIWPLYVAGQAAIAWGVVTVLRQEARA
ncbi:MAG: lysoplasmalogenase family protein [Pseudomonadota bacterium]